MNFCKIGMNQLSLILLFNFKTSLSLVEDIKVAESRIEEFWALKGLQQKYYLQEPTTPEVVGLHLWEFEEDFLEFFVFSN